jgi:DNA (cytosine-5)-methyltransferase 1
VEKRNKNKRGAAMKKYSVVSLFSGCGGMDLGFGGNFKFLEKFYPALPFRIDWSNDFNPFACRTYRHNLGHDILIGDIWENLSSLPKSCDVIVGGFPCQDISINGKRLGVAGKRSGLYRAMVEAVKRCRPKVFVAENVRGLLYKYNEASLKQVLIDFAELGYKVTYQLYNVANYGVPQGRERVIIIGVKDDAAIFVPPLAVLDRKTWISSKDAISDLEDKDVDPEFSHVWSLARKSSDLGSQGNRVLIANRVAHTVRAECHGNNQFHYNLPRRISMREAARFQSFPDNFLFQAKLRETERMIGNAVPPVFAWHIAKSIVNLLEDIEMTQLAKAA